MSPFLRVALIVASLNPLANAASQLAAAPSPLDGFWVTSDGDWVVEIAPCTSGYCGQLVGLSKSHRPNALRLDAHNPDPARRGKPLCGLFLMGGFKPSPTVGDQWDDGWIYNPQSGKTYSSQMHLTEPDTLNVRGYLLIPLFGRNETLTRETGPINRCFPSPA